MYKGNSNGFQINVFRADETLAKLQIAMAKADVIVTTGSVSMGERDLLKHVLREDLNADIHFGRVNLKPG